MTIIYYFCDEIAFSGHLTKCVVVISLSFDLLWYAANSAYVHIKCFIPSRMYVQNS